ncbi:MAG: 4Fe-4S binding protein, partial [Candidatus Omnitrophota bacterium]|nr:4Fe-4S binding protein [Candidatus Omnitrophota bacterium]
MKSDVYFIEVKTNDLEARCDSLQKLLEKVNPFKDYKKDEFIPVKLTIGDSQCVYNIHPELVKIAVSEIKKVKARPFLFDTNVIYKGERLNATGHILSGYAGAIKNVAMGMVSKPTKQVQHSSLKPHIIEKKCTSCGCCIRICPAEAISFKKEKAFIDQTKCIG